VGPQKTEFVDYITGVFLCLKGETLPLNNPYPSSSSLLIYKRRRRKERGFKGGKEREAHGERI
jgi:hypothetical protein